MSTKPIIHRGFATGIKHWHVAQIQHDLFTVRNQRNKFTLVECNTGPAFVEGRKSTFIKSLDLMNLQMPPKEYIIHLLGSHDERKLQKDMNSYLQSMGFPKTLHNVGPHTETRLEKLIESDSEGLIYIDPPGSIPPFHVYSKMANISDFSHYDFLLNIFPRSWKRHLGKKNPPNHIKKSGVPLHHLPEYIAMLNRKYWYVRDSSGLYGAILLFGTNNPHSVMDEWQYKIDMHSVTTEYGASIFDRHSKLQNKK